MSIAQQNHVYICPESCGSSAGYYVTVTDYTDKKTQKTEYSLSATVVLADCSHKIDWSFAAGDVDKIDAAIHLLQDFRKKFLDAEKMVTKLNKQQGIPTT